jgi:hypothetical protein
MTTTHPPTTETLDLPCPDWCTLPAGHRWDRTTREGVDRRQHQGPRFGEYVVDGATEYRNQPGAITTDVMLCETDRLGVTLTLEECRVLGESLIEAAAWLEVNPS